MAPRSAKRAAAKAPPEEPAAKRIMDFLKEQGISRASYLPAVEIVNHPLSGLPEEVRRMLLAMLPWSVAARTDERHEAQASCVRMVDEVVEIIRSTLQKAMDAEVATLAEIESKKADLEAAVLRTEAAEAEARRAEEERRGQLQEVEATLRQKEAAFQEAELQEKRLGAEREEACAQRAQLEEVLSNSFARLKDGVIEDSERESSIQAVVSAVAKLDIEESLAIALPAVLAKRHRGAFDIVVIEQAEQGMRSSLISFGEIADAATAAWEPQAAAEQVARADLDGAVVARAESAAALRGAAEAAIGATTATTVAKDALRELEPTFAAAAAARDEKCAEFQQFSDYSSFMWTMLRDRAPIQQREQPAEQQLQQDVEVALEAEVVGS